jgi:peptidoglycan/xylan/chitin deacetylase (PgdA/CDA1 family)
MRAAIRKIVLDILSFRSKPSSNVHILNGHFIEECETEKSQQNFETFIKKIMLFYDIIGLDEAVLLIENNVSVSSPKVSLTFDDGFLECYTQMLPVLEKYKVKASFFINPMSIENHDNEFSESFIKNNLRVSLSKKFMNWDMVREIQSLGHVIGSHTISHANMRGLSSPQLQNEVLGAKKIIEKATGVSCDFFAFPFGNSDYFDQKAIDEVNSVYKYAFTSSLYSKYFHEGNRQILSRRHFECNWSFNHIKYFTSGKRESNFNS